MRTWMLIVLGAALGGCQQAAMRATEDYYERIEFRKPTASLERAGIGETSAPVTEEDIQRALAQTATLKVPLKLAFYEVAGAPDGYHSLRAQRLRQLPPKDRERWQRKLTDSNLYSGVQEVAGILLPERFDLKRLRLGAARLGCDVRLIYATNSDVHHYTNALAATYLLIVPIWLVPGNHVDCFTGLSAAVVDVKTGKLLAGFSTVGEGRQVVPASLEGRGERKAAVRARLEAIDRMADKLVALAKAVK